MGGAEVRLGLLAELRDLHGVVVGEVQVAAGAVLEDALGHLRRRVHQVGPGALLGAGELWRWALGCQWEPARRETEQMRSPQVPCLG